MPENAFHHHAACTRRIKAHQLAELLRDRVKLPIRAHRHAVRIRVTHKLAHLFIQPNSVNLVVRCISKKHLAVRIACWTTGALKALGQKLPAFTGNNDLLRTRSARSCFHALRPALPQKGHRFQKVLTIARHMAALNAAKLIVIAREFQRLVHLQVDQVPVARAVFHVMSRRGQVGADRLRFKLAHHRGEFMPAAKRHPASARRIHAAEGLRPVPRRREGRNAAAATARDTAVVAISGQLQVKLLRHKGQQFIIEETHILIAHAIILQITVTPVHRAFHRCRQRARLHKDANGHRHLLRGDECLQEGLLPCVVPIRLHIHTRRLGAIVLRRNEYRHIAHRAGKNLALVKLRLLDRPWQNILRLDHGCHVSGRSSSGVSTGNRTPRQRFDLPLQMLVIRVQLPKIDLGARLLLSTLIVNALGGSMPG